MPSKDAVEKNSEQFGCKFYTTIDYPNTNRSNEYLFIIQQQSPKNYFLNIVKLYIRIISFDTSYNKKVLASHFLITTYLDNSEQSKFGITIYN